MNEVRLNQFLKSYSLKDNVQTFKKSVKTFDATLIPPCKAELLQQLRRVTFVSNIWCNAHLQLIRNVGNVVDYGWKFSDDCYNFHWFDGDAMPSTIDEIVINNKATEEDPDQLTNNVEGKYKLLKYIILKW